MSAQLCIDATHIEPYDCIDQQYVSDPHSPSWKVYERPREFPRTFGEHIQQPVVIPVEVPQLQEYLFDIPSIVEIELPLALPTQMNDYIIC